MILEAKNTTVAFRCPHCGAGIMSMVGVFSLSGNMFKLKCDCGASVMEIRPQNDGNVRLTVPCLFCPPPHTFTVSKTLFFGRDIFLLPCPISGMDIGFIGTESDVRDALERTEKELHELLRENGLEDFDMFRPNEEDEEPIDPAVYDMVMFVIKDLQEAGDIRCSCNEGPYSIDIFEDCIRVSCDSCGDFEDLPLDSPMAASALLETDRLFLTNKKPSDDDK
jgi:hypothetical protein